MKSVLILLGLFLTFQTSAQVLSLNNLITVYGKHEEEIDTYLSNKGWERAQTTSELAQATWSYDRRIAVSIPGEGDSHYEARSWLTLSNLDGERIITYSINKAKMFNAFKAQVLALGMRRVEYIPSNTDIVVVYEGANYRVHLITMLNKGSLIGNNTYMIYLNKKH